MNRCNCLVIQLVTPATVLSWSFPDTDSVRDNNPEVAQPKLPLGGRSQLIAKIGGDRMQTYF